MRYIFYRIKEKITNIRLKKFYSFSDSLSDYDFICKKYEIVFNKKLNLLAPKTFNEKLQWLKLYYRKSTLTLLADKVSARDYVKEILGDEFLIPLIKVYNSPAEIDFDELPNQFVMKCNHNSGKGMVICINKNKLEYQHYLNVVSSGFSENYFLHNREWPYKNIKHKILVEKYMGNNNGHGLNDYKFYCFNGKVKYFLVTSDRLKKVKFSYFDSNLSKLPFIQGAKTSKISLDKIPVAKMIDIVEKLAKNLPHVRIDMYYIDDKIYFGEFTFLMLVVFNLFLLKNGI